MIDAVERTEAVEAREEVGAVVEEAIRPKRILLGAQKLWVISDTH